MQSQYNIEHCCLGRPRFDGGHGNICGLGIHLPIHLWRLLWSSRLLKEKGKA